MRPCVKGILCEWRVDEVEFTLLFEVRASRFGIRYPAQGATHL
jgi:hypothetical protein